MKEEKVRCEDMYDPGNAICLVCMSIMKMNKCPEYVLKREKKA